MCEVDWSQSKVFLGNIVTFVFFFHHCLLGLPNVFVCLYVHRKFTTYFGRRGMRRVRRSRVNRSILRLSTLVLVASDNDICHFIKLFRHRHNCAVTYFSMLFLTNFFVLFTEAQ